MKKETAEVFFGLAEYEKGSEVYESNKENMKNAITKAHELGGTHIVRFEVLNMCSSKFGEGKSVIIGPSCTIKDLDDAMAGKLDTELASTTKFPVAYMEVPA